jgi:hypothetical protein
MVFFVFHCHNTSTKYGLSLLCIVIKMETALSKSELEICVKSKYSFGEVVPELTIHNPFWSHGEYELVGHGKQTNLECGKFKKFMGCLKIDLHNQVRWFFPDLKKNTVFVKSVYHSCGKPTCSKCYKFGWAVREASRMERRLKEASKRFGLVEHIVVSSPSRLFGESLEALRKKAHKIMCNRGIIGGSMIFHGFRFANRRESVRKGVPFGWRWSPHFHVIGFVGGEGYGHCRKCKGADCYVCSGFEGVTRREHKKDGWVVRVLDERKTVGGTCWYQLHHCSVRRGSKKSHAVTWFGVCSYRKQKLINGDDVGVKHKCPICSCDLVRVRYLGVFSELSISRRGEKVSMFSDDGEPLWEVVSGKRFEGG